MTVFASIAGVALLILVIIDVVSSTFGQHGGPVTRRLIEAAARGVRRLPHSRRFNCHRRIGPFTTLGVIVGWLVSFAFAWFLVLLGVQGAATDTVDLTVSNTDIWFLTVSTVSGLGPGRIQVDHEGWMVLRTIIGLMSTLLIGFIVSFAIPLIDAAASKRAFARRIAHMDDERLAERLAEDESLRNALCWKLLEQHEAHVTYPTLRLHYDSDPSTDASFQLIRLHDALQSLDTDEASELEQILEDLLLVVAAKNDDDVDRARVEVAQTAGWAGAFR